MPTSKRRTTRKSTPKPKTPQEEAAQQISGGVVVTLVGGVGQQVFNIKMIEGSTVREGPTLLRQAATNLEKQLVGE